MEKDSFPKPDWHVLSKEGCTGVEARVCLVDQRAVVAMLRLGEKSNTDIHPAPYDIHVLCIEGSGFAMCDGVVIAIASGESVLWPKGKEHNIYTEGSSMTTIMVEHVHQTGE
ncbi:MAG: hypothetical protein RIC89_09850 [Pseudomonadales bacterium]